MKNNSKQFIHMLLALRRTKDNPGYPTVSFREIIYEESVDVERLKLRCKAAGGVWRIHKTINKRDTHKAMNLLRKHIIDHEIDTAERLQTVWRTKLMERKSKAERNILLDIDSEVAKDTVFKILQENSINIVDSTPSPKGHHVVIDATKVDTRLFDSLEDVTLQRDGYIFVEHVDYGEVL